MANRDLLKEAIADAKAVKETAIANAKAALEEAFTPLMQEKFAKKIAQLDEEETELEEAYGMEEGEEKEMQKTYEVEEAEAESTDSMEEGEELDLEELLRELDEMEEGEKEEMMEGEEDLINDPKTPTAHGNVAEAEEEEEEEEIDIENMDEDDLKSFIESVIADMVAAGELEGGEGMEGEEGEEEEGKEEMGVEAMDEVNEMKKEVEEAKKAKEKAEKELKEALDTVSIIKNELQEVNLFNAKLLYTNKIFKAKNLTESQKVKVLAAFDKAASVKEAKLVFETLSEGFKEKKSPVNESMLRGSASKASGVVAKKPIMEVNDQFARWQKLAGIK